MNVPDDVREAMARAIARVEHDSFQVGGVGEGLAELDPEAAFDCYVDHVDAALSALEAAGFEVNRKGTLEALALAAERLSVAAEPQFRLTLSEEARAEIERLERANAAAAVTLTASRHKEKQDG